MFAFREKAGSVELAFTDRHGGVSTGPWSSLNFGTSNGDDPALVEENLRIASEAFGAAPARVVRMSQLHSADVYVADESSDMSLGVPYADAIVTTAPEVAILVRAADCAPVVLADPANAVIGVVHAGRKGMVLGVCGAAVEAMRALGADQIHAWVGPRACGRCYEVPEQMRKAVSAEVPDAWSVTSWGTAGLDIGAGVSAQLEALGVDVTDLADQIPACTIESDGYFSYRRQGQHSGRFGALAMIRA